MTAEQYGIHPFKSFQVKRDKASHARFTTFTLLLTLMIAQKTLSEDTETSSYYSGESVGDGDSQYSSFSEGATYEGDSGNTSWYQTNGTDWSSNTAGTTTTTTTTGSDDGTPELTDAQKEAIAQLKVSQQSTSFSIGELEPNAGPTYGDTRVLVRGGPFSGMNLTYPSPKCKFGHDDMIVDATYVLCTATARNVVNETEARHKDKDLYCLQCDNSPAITKAENISFTISMTGDFSDVINSLVYRYYTPTKIHAIYPHYGPKDGETVVQIWGENFIDFGQRTRCAFGTKTVDATFINPNYMICVSPFSDVVEKAIPFTISLNSQQNSKTDVSYWYYSWPAITELVPDRGPDAGGTRVLVKGRNFLPFKEHSDKIDNANDTFCKFENLAKVPATIINSTKAICYSPPSYILRSSIVEITLNNQQYTDDNTVFYYYRPPYLFDVDPRQGPVSGGTRVTFIGSNFRNTGNITAKFGEKTVPGKYLSTSEVEAYSPATDKPGYVPLSVSMEQDMYSQPVQYLYYEKPVVDHIEPQSGPDYGYTQITVVGSNFVDMGHNKALCVFNKTIFTNATIMSTEEMKCDSPSLINNQGYSTFYQGAFYYLEVTIDGGREISGPKQRFIYYKDPKLASIEPDSGPVAGGTTVDVVGTGLTQQYACQQGACNTTVRFAGCERKPLTDSNETDTVLTVTSPPANVSGSVVVAVALNGQQFSKDYVLHLKDDENTFTYYEEPFISGFHPQTGPSSGGSKIKINGFGFTQRKDKWGNYDKKKNKVWVRMVNPETGEVLTASKEVDPDSLSDDEAVWETSGLPPGTKALLQLSLNGQDWTNVNQPGKPYSFDYYSSPHLVQLHPSFGKVKAKNKAYMDIQGTNLICPDTNCSQLMVRFGEPPNQAIYVKGTWLNDSYVRTEIPKYTKPDVLRVEVTVNGQDYTNDKLTYGYYDPYVLNAEPRLISVDGTTKVSIKGFGFVNSSHTKSDFNNPDKHITCSNAACRKNAEYIDKNTLLTNTFPQATLNYANGDNVLWDPITVNAAVYEDDFTENDVQVWYYDDPSYNGLSEDESPANIQTGIFVKTDFKSTPQERLEKFSNFTVRFTGPDGQVVYRKARMTRNPIQQFVQGNNNAIFFRTPKWNMTSPSTGSKKSSETVKVDIALNGQDYKGGFDFTFTQQLEIDRIVPMGGPVQGNTNTRVIGSGYKPPKGHVDQKWGILGTDPIVKSQVTDYIYYKTSFENIIEGNEALKAYAYEASRFAKVDSIMGEGDTYHSVFMKSPKMLNWTKTQGGPYYIEVGKNDSSVQYYTQQNVSTTTKIENVTPVINEASGNSSSNDTNSSSDSNSTSDTNTTTTTTTITAPTYTYVTTWSIQNVSRNWTYYDYDPSNVEFYYYKDCIIKEMMPHSGLHSGGTQVQVVGAWFKYLPEYGVVPHCKFGDKIVRAEFDSTVRIICSAPPSNELGVELAFDVSLNGVDWSNSGLKFTYYEQPNLSRISPDCGPESGGKPIYIIGENITNMSNPNEFNCKFTPFTLHLPPKTAPAIFMNSTTIMCASPGGWGTGDAMHLQVTFNGGDYDQNNFTYTFFSVKTYTPKSGPSDGTGGDIIVQGQGFKNDSNPLCKLNGTIYYPVAVTWNEIHCPMPKAQGGDSYYGNVAFSVAPNGIDWNPFVGGFQYYQQPIVTDIYPKQGPNIGLAVINYYGSGFRDDYTNVELGCKVGDSIGKAVYVSSSQIKCVVEDMELTNEGEYLPAQVALNNYSWSGLSNSTYYLPYGIESIFPMAGPTTGVTDVIITGKGFVEEAGDAARCRFGTPANYAIVDAQILSYEKIVCKAPADFALASPNAFPHDVPFSLALVSDEYDPWTETYHKFRIYEQPQLLYCDPCEVNVGTIQEVLVVADKNYEFFEPVPVNMPTANENAGPSVGGLGGIMCQFGRFGVTQAIYINETVVKCVTPAVDDDPDSIYREIVKLSISMNGQDYEEETNNLEFTFVGTGSYLVFWPFIIGALLIGLLIVALVVCCATIFQKMSMDDMLAGKGYVGNEGQPHVFNIGGGMMVPRGRADWHAERSSVDMLERAAGTHFS